MLAVILPALVATSLATAVTSSLVAKPLISGISVNLAYSDKSTSGISAIAACISSTVAITLSSFIVTTSLVFKFIVIPAAPKSALSHLDTMARL